MTTSENAATDRLTAADVAAILGVTLTRVRQLDHVLRPVLEGRRKIYSRAVIEAFVVERAK